MHALHVWDRLSVYKVNLKLSFSFCDASTFAGIGHQTATRPAGNRHQAT
ncbi:MAG: hypothetical protein VB026_04840 [Anaerolineaceae bacterium]|nr:hypothetical protein [Anaerolineaceae bacterium]